MLLKVEDRIKKNNIGFGSIVLCFFVIVDLLWSLCYDIRFCNKFFWWYIIEMVNFNECIYEYVLIWGLKLFCGKVL